MRYAAKAVCLIVMLGVGLGGSVEAAQIDFSGELSDMDQPDLSVFQASIVYDFDPTTNVLTMQVFNNTVYPDGYTLSELFFNVSDDVTGMTILDNGGFTRASLTENGRAGGFGIFDFFFDFQSKGPGGANYGLAPNSSVTLTFRVTGDHLDTSDFFYGYSTGGGKDKGDAIAAIKFTQGPGDDSVYAIQLTRTDLDVIPEPTSLVLLGTGVLGFLIRKKRA